MADILGSVLTGLCTGIGIYIANYLGEKHIKERLNNISNALTELKKNIKGNNNQLGEGGVKE